MGLNYSIHNLIDQKYAIEDRISEINRIKKMVEGYISGNFSTSEHMAENFYYTLFVDKNQFVYQFEWDDVCAYHKTKPLKIKYRLSEDW